MKREVTIDHSQVKADTRNDSLLILNIEILSSALMCGKFINTNIGFRKQRHLL